MNCETVIVVYDPGSTFYEKAEHIKTLVNYQYDKTYIGTETPSWISTIQNFNIRAESHGVSSLWKRTERGSTI